MEPFGILQFLQSLLAKTPETPTASTTSEPPTTKQEPPPQSEKPEPSHDAIVRFMEAHESRSNRLKKR